MAEWTRQAPALTWLASYGALLARAYYMAESAGMAYVGGMIVPGLPSEGLPGHKIRNFLCILPPKAIDASCILGLPILPQKNLIQCIIGTVGSRGPHSIVQSSALSRYLLTKRNGFFFGGKGLSGANLN